MSKKTPVKKSKRRLKRSVRRSFALALMITAIAVAAIPVPENFAEDGTGGGSGNDPSAPIVSSTEAYRYPAEDMKDKYKQSFGVDLKKPSDSSKIYSTHYISATAPDDENGGVSYRMEWQYQYFLKTINGLEKGIICGYNDSYNVDLLTVSTDPIHDYVVVRQDAYNKFKTDRGNDEFTLSSNPSEADELDQQFRIYFPQVYEKQVEDYKKYEADIATYDKRLAEYQKKLDDLIKEHGNGLTDEQIEALIGKQPEKPEKPKPITKKASEFSTENDEYSWRLYYCDKTPALKGYILVKVADSELSGEVTVHSYVPRRIDTSQIDLSVDDELGFKVQDWTSFLGIGDEAFKNVANVSNIELPEALKYIGDSAFEGSFITSIKMMNLENIGNYAFKNCPRLSSIEMVQGVKNIGTEAFYGLTLIRSVVFPGEIEYIGPGAFANCSLLETIDLSSATLEVVIDDYAFYNDGALSKINFNVKGAENTSIYVTTIGKAAFAVWDGVSGGLSEFVFPSRISTKRKEGAFGYESKGLGDYVLAGRTNLKDVTMPAAYGMSAEISLPKHIFQNCVGLERVNFPDTGSSCGFVKFDEDIFASVTTPGFYVQGPPYTEPSNRNPALPRKSTWTAYSAAASMKDGKRVPNIPYVYYLNGKRYTEVCDGDYLMCIDQDGVLISCSLHPDKTAKLGSVDLIIPAEVAGTVVTGIASDCFANDVNEPDNRKMSKVVRTLTIKDDSKLATISDSVFADWTQLERVYLGNSVRNVGNSAFQNCKSLIDVYFNTPESAAADFKIGTNAFQTNSVELTFHGIISPSYAPFAWAMQEDNTIDDMGRGKRICYKSLMPTSFTVMRDSGTNQVTLLDYPKYDQIASILGESYAVKNGVYMSASFDPVAYYNGFMESTYYNLYSSTQFDAKREEFKNAWISTGDKESLYANSELYGPWISPTWINATEFTRSTADTGNSIVDFFFEPITVHAANGKPDAYFAHQCGDHDYAYDVYANYERTGDVAGDYQRYTQEEWNLLNATRNIKVPDGVTSIDVKGFLTSEVNSPNLSYIDRNKIGAASYDMYNKTSVDSTLGTDRFKDIHAGLFSGKYKDYKTNVNPDDGEEEVNENELLEKGNDRLESIDLNQVTSLPDYAFDSCENLKTVKIGATCTDINKLPFRGCTSLTTLEIAEGNPKYLTENRILYSKNDDVSLTLEECLETRGKNSDNSVVTSASDAKIPLVTRIANAAFEDCNYVSTINLTDATGLTVIPESCFRDCDALSEVDLPLSVNKIDKYAFWDDLIGKVKIPGREVFISTDAFKKEENKTQPTYIITYEDSSARRYADTYGEEYKLVWEDVGEMWSVNFYDSDGTLLKAMQVQDGFAVKTTEIPEAKKEGFTFDKWVGTNNVDVQDEIRQDTDFIAQYHSNSQMVDGKWAVDFYDGVTGEAFWPTQYVEDGGAAEEPPYAPHHDGYKFLKYSADFSKVTSNMSIVALYEVDGAGKPGGSTNTSGGTTNNPNGSGGSTTNKSQNTTKTSSGSTSNTSGSSTSSTSSTSAKPRHTVTVVNGYGSGSYAEGETVIIVANEPAPGQKFSQWRTSSEGVELVMILASATTFVMPANNVLVTAEFTGGTTPATTTPAPTVGTVTTNPGGNTATTTPSSNNGNTRVDITKPGISNKNLATANVNGTTDNFIVKISETPEATQAVINALNNKYGNLDNILYYAMDISLYDSTGTTKITDTTGISVDITIPLPDALVTYGGNNMMGAVVASDQLEDLSERFTTIAGVPCVSFTATHFSPYTVYVNTQNLSEGLLDVTPKTGDPIHPKWFLSLGLASLSIILFMKRDRKVKIKTT